jgi:hypothetical protein
MINAIDTTSAAMNPPPGIWCPRTKRYAATISDNGNISRVTTTINNG